MNFTDRLLEYRNSLKLNKKQMAEKLGVSESYYGIIENGKRNVPKSFLTALVVESEKPEEYWLYGVSNEEYKKMRDELKSIKMAIDVVKENIDIEDLDVLFSDNKEKSEKILSSEKILIYALKSDLSYLLAEKKKATRD